MANVTWEASYQTAERYHSLVEALKAFEITEQEFAEQVAMLPGYPLPRPPTAGDNITLVLNMRPMSYRRRPPKEPTT